MKEYLKQDRFSKEYNWLIKSKSPYLLQHATNPVNWLEWSPEAFQKAKEKESLYLCLSAIPSPVMGLIY